MPATENDYAIQEGSEKPVLHKLFGILLRSKCHQVIRSHGGFLGFLQNISRHLSEQLSQTENNTRGSKGTAEDLSWPATFIRLCKNK